MVTTPQNEAVENKTTIISKVTLVLQAAMFYCNPWRRSEM